jgi:hypothetical protein
MLSRVMRRSSRSTARNGPVANNQRTVARITTAFIGILIMHSVSSNPRARTSTSAAASHTSGQALACSVIAPIDKDSANVAAQAANERLAKIERGEDRGVKTPIVHHHDAQAEQRPPLHPTEAGPT